MATLALRFPGGRYHATPWGHHVNEGLVEWPPSPWRLLRALVACGYATERWQDVPYPAKRLIEALSATLPKYRLPAGCLAHSRHYMPTTVLDKGRERTTLVFDAWADVGASEMLISWPCPLDDEESRLLALLAAHLGYLGRSESWVDARLVPDSSFNQDLADAFPHTDGARPERGWEQLSLMAAEPANSYVDWRREAVEKALAALPLPGTRKASRSLLRKRQVEEAAYPLDLIDCLQRDTRWWRSRGWSQPPGSRRVLYWRRADSLLTSPVTRKRRSVASPVSMMFLALTTPSGRRSALPPRARTLPQSELLHRALVSRVGRGAGVDCPELTGRDSDGLPLEGHKHGHVLPLDLDNDGRLDHILIYAPMGLGGSAQSAIRSLERTWAKGGIGELQLAVAGWGSLDHLRALPAPWSVGVSALLGPAQGSRVWQSLTPFVPPRHEKPRGRNTLSNQLLSELESRGLPRARVEVLPFDTANLEFRHWVRRRRYPAKLPPADVGFAVRLVFEVPVQGPVALGYASHFGLGVFRACE